MTGELFATAEYHTSKTRPSGCSATSTCGGE